MKIRYILTTIVISVVMMFTVIGCGGGGGSSGGTTSSSEGGESGGVDNSVPTDAASAIDYQYDKVSDTIALFKELRNGEDAAHQALNEGRYTDWDDFWQNQYPILVARLNTAGENLKQSEDYIQTLVYGLTASVAKNKTVSISLPEAVLASMWIAAIAFVVAEYNGYINVHQSPPTQSQTDVFIENRTSHWESQGLAPIAASTRAIAESTQIKTLQGLQTGIEGAKVYVIEGGLKPGFGQYLPDEVSTFIDMKELKDNLTKASEYLYTIFTSKECESSESQRLRSVLLFPHDADRQAEAVALGSQSSLPAGCRVYFCSTEDGICPNLPVGEWEATVFLPGYLRDVDRNVVASAGVPATVDINPIAAGDIENGDAGDVPQPSVEWGIGGMIGWQWQLAKEECEKNGEHLPTIAQLRQAYSECLTERGLPQGANCVPDNFYTWRYYWSSEESGNTAAAFYFGDAGEGNDGGKVWADASKDKYLDAVCVRSH